MFYTKLGVTDVLQPTIMKWLLTIIGDIRNLEAFATVPLVRLKLDPKLARARGKGYGSLVGLTCLVGCDGSGHSWGKSTEIIFCELALQFSLQQTAGIQILFHCICFFRKVRRRYQ